MAQPTCPCCNGHNVAEVRWPHLHFGDRAVGILCNDCLRVFWAWSEVTPPCASV